VRRREQRISLDACSLSQAKDEDPSHRTMLEVSPSLYTWLMAASSLRASSESAKDRGERVLAVLRADDDDDDEGDDGGALPPLPPAAAAARQRASCH